MSARKRGNNKRQPRTTDVTTPCISIMPDGTTSIYKPTRKPPRKGIAKIDGVWRMTEIERALY